MKLSPFSPLRALIAGLVWLACGFTLAFAQSTLPSARVGQSYSFQVTTNPPAAAGTIYGATGLPAGLSINASSGVISGTPVAAGTSTGNITVTSGGLSDNLAYVLVVNPATGTPEITSATTAAGTVGAAFTYSVTANNSPTSFNIGTLPPGLSVGGTTTAPTIIGTPTVAGPYQVSLSANNSAGTGAAKTLTITIGAASGAPVINSAATASSAVNAAFNYAITATNAPTSYAASGLPVGLSLNALSGVISGTPSVGGVYPVTLTATNATGTSAEFTLTITIGGVSAINSTLTASGTVGSAFSYTLTGTNTPTSFNAGPLPAGLTANGTTGVISGTPTMAGVSSVTVSANNALGQGPSSVLTITIAAAPTPPPGGGGGVIPPPPTSSGTPPVITTQPSSQTVAAGTSVTLSVSAAGTGLTFQWRKNGTAISGATASTLTLASVSASDEGSYSVSVSSGSLSATSSVAVLTVTAPADRAPAITTQPVGQSFSLGGSATLSVGATGSDPLAYQWFKDGVALTGATSANLALVNLGASAAGTYSVRVSNQAGSVTSNPAVLSVRGAGSYFGTFGGNGGTFALFVRNDGTGVFLGYARTGRIALISRDIVIGADGRFSVVVIPATGTPVAATSTAGTPPVAAHEGDYHIEGVVAASGVSGTVSGLNLSFAAPAGSTAGTTANLAGFYQAGAAGGSATSYLIIGPAGDAFIITVAGGTADAGRGTATPAGALTVTTESNAAVTGSVQPAAGTISTTVTPATGAAVTFIGANNDARTEVEKLVNVSTRTQAGTDSNTLIAGFVVTGTERKPVLVRAIGPTLSAFNVPNPLGAARLEVFRGSTAIAVGLDWGAGANAAAIASTATRVGAFALANNSRDAALLLSLEPGAYTAVVTGQGGATGVALVEVYDASEGVIARSERIINVSTRATAGTAENTLIAGFVINGTVPKRVLIRGAGPSLTQFGVTGALARPQLTVYSGSTAIAQNAGWSTSADAAVMAAAAQQVGAFAFGASSQDSALILHLAPGAYTAQITGAGGTTGVALVEVYEVP